MPQFRAVARLPGPREPAALDQAVRITRTSQRRELRRWRFSLLGHSMKKEQLAAYLVQRLTAAELLDAFNCWSEGSQTLAADVLDRLVEQSSSGTDFVRRYDAACDDQAAEIQQLRAESERLASGD